MATSPSVHEGLLSLRSVPEGRSLTIRASGELDIATAQTLDSALRQAFAGDASSITLDVAQVSFIDSYGLRTLLWAANYAREHGDRLRIRSGPGLVRRMIELTGVDRSLPLAA